MQRGMLPAGISSAFSCSNKPGGEIIKLTFSSGTTGNDKNKYLYSKSLPVNKGRLVQNQLEII
jgi:hypothetical protein